MKIVKAALVSLLAWSLLSDVQGDDVYGVDCSFPIHSKEWQCGGKLGNRQKVYDEFMDGCRKKFGLRKKRCDVTEEDRIEMSVRQPQSMVNYTSTGFKKIRAPKELWDLLSDHWEKNKDSKKKEEWGVGNVYTNNWASPTYMVSVEDTGLRGGGSSLKNKIWDAARPTIEQWTGMELKPTSQYGIRIYTEGAVLNPHVDRLPLVSSCIVNVAQDVDEPWPLEVYNRHDNAVNVTMEPGDMVLYESGSLIHGRPFPMKGRYYANIFIHFEPTGRKLGDTSNSYLEELDDFYPPYLLPGSPELPYWKARNPRGWAKPFPSAPRPQYQAQEGHAAAALGDVDRLSRLAAKDKKALQRVDENGWQPIHEAARGGHKDAIELLVKNGAGLNARTGVDGKGSSPLNLALSIHSKSHPVVEYLLSIGAEDIEADEL